jgi:RND family efflux transporter MFP subunit
MMRGALLHGALLGAILALSAVTAARADDPAPSVLVKTVMPTRGSLPLLVEAYGTAAPALDGGMTLSVQQDGRVTAIAVTPGEIVKQGERLLEFGASATASSAYQQAVNALSLARSEREHMVQLLGQKLATRDQLAQADKAVADAQATLDALRREGAGSAVQTLTAPFDGIIAAIPVAQGDRVQPGTPLLTLTRLDGLVVTIGIEPAQRAQIHVGDPAHLDRLGGGAPIEARIIRVDGMLNAKTRLIDADVAVPAGSVISGESFHAAITCGQMQGWVVPHEAVLIDDKGAYVFQIAGDKAARVDVRVLGTVGERDSVDGPIDGTRRLVVQGNYQLSDGTPVREAPAQDAAR